MLRRHGLLVDGLCLVLRILALVYSIVDHRIVIAFTLPVLDSWGHRHGWKVNSVAVLTLDLRHTSLDLIGLGIARRAVARLNVAVIAASSGGVLLSPRGH